MAFGGVIKLQGESEYRAALKQIQNSLAVVGSEMQKVTSQFAKGEKSIKSLSSVNEVLNKRLQEQQKAVSAANKMLAEAQSKYDESSKAVQTWEQKLEAAKKALEAAKNSTTASADEIEKLENNVKECEQGLSKANTENEKYNTTVQKWQTELNKAEAAVNKTTREINDNKNAMEALESTTDKAADEVDDLSDSMDDLSDSENKAERATEKANSGFTVLKGTLANLAADAIRKAADAMKDFAGSMLDAAAEVKASNSQFQQTFGDLQNDATAALDRVGKSTGILKTRLQDTASGIYAFAKASGADSTEAMKLMETALMATADSAAYYDKSLEESAETLQSFLKGNFANDAALGLSATEFTRNAKAAEMFGEKYNDLTEIQKQQTLLQMVVDAQKASGAFGQASREADGWANVQGNLNESWKQFKANVGAPFLEALIPVLQSVTEKLSSMTEKIDWEAFQQGVHKTAEAIAKGFGWLVDHGDTIISILAGIAAGFAAFKVVVIIQKAVVMFKALVTAIKSVGLAQTALNIIMAANPIGLIVAAIAGLVTAFTVLWNKSESFRNFWKGMWEEIKNTTEKYIGAVVNFFTNAWENIKAAWNTVTEFFAGIWEGIQEAFSAVGEWFGEKFESAKENIISIFTAVKTFLSETWDNIKTSISEKIDAIKSGITTVFNSVKDFIAKVWESIKNTISDKINSAKEIISNVVNAISNVISSIFNGIRNTVSNIWDGIKNAISNAINGARDIVSSVVNSISSTVSSVFNGIKNTATSIWDGIKNTIKNAIEGARDFVKNAIDKIKGFFNFEWKLPKIKLPHFSIKGEFSLSPPSVPHLSVDWYAKAMKRPMLLDSPTIFGMQGGKLLGAGEAGAEVVSGASTLMDMIKNAVSSANYSSVPSSSNIHENARAYDTSLQYKSIVSAFKDALREMKVEMDSDEMGRFVERTVADAIYT